MNYQLSRVRYAIDGMKADDIHALLDTLPADSETIRAIRQIKTIKNIGDATAMEILLAVIAVIEKNGD